MCMNEHDNGVRVINSADLKINDISEAISLDPNNAEKYFERASYYEIRDKGSIFTGVAPELSKAIADYSEAIRLKPDYLDAYLKRFQCYKTMGLKDEAVADYNHLIRLNPDYGHGSKTVMYGIVTKTIAIDVRI